MGLTLKGWNKAKSADVVKSGGLEKFPVGRGQEALFTELSCRNKDGDPEKPDFMLKFESTDGKKCRGAMYFSPYDDSGVSQNGKEWEQDGEKETHRLIQAVKRLGYDLTGDDEVTPEDVMKAIKEDRPVATIDVVQNGKYTNYYIKDFVRYSGEDQADATEEPSEESEEDVVDEVVEDFTPEKGMLVEATPPRCKTRDEYLVTATNDDGTFDLKRIKDKKEYTEVDGDKIFKEV